MGSVAILAQAILIPTSLRPLAMYSFPAAMLSECQNGLLSKRKARRAQSWESAKALAGQFPTLQICHETKRVWWHGGKYFSGENLLHLQRFVAGRRFLQHRMMQEATSNISDIDKLQWPLLSLAFVFSLPSTLPFIQL